MLGWGADKNLDWIYAVSPGRSPNSMGLREPSENVIRFSFYIYALVNEGVRLLEEGFATRASNIDVVYLTGYGFPAWRGGPMHYAVNPDWPMSSAQ